MRPDEPSRTAAFVAAARGLGVVLPAEARLCDDPFGARFAGTAPAAIRRLALEHPRVATTLLPIALRPLLRGLVWLQLRMRVLDDAVRQFAGEGGRQVVLLGAGYDCRAARFANELGDAVVFEVDHPATQSRKRMLLEELAAPSAPVRYVAFDFERQAVADLPSRLVEAGLDVAARTLLLWEGVTMYLSPEAIEATLAAVRTLAAEGSVLAFTYFDADRIARPRLYDRLLDRVVARGGEPFRFGWRPIELPAWLTARGFELLADRTEAELGRLLLPPRWARLATSQTRHIALARRRD